MLPEPVQEQGKKLIGKVQDIFYGEVMKPKVTGRAFIPHNRNTIVVANHGSHLDMGFVRHALGTYGEDIVSLAAQDYFFEKGTLQRAFFENFTNLRAIDRKGGLRASVRQAGEILEQRQDDAHLPRGHALDRRRGPGVQAARSATSRSRYGVDILPVYLGGTHEAMPKGGKLPTAARSRRAHRSAAHASPT